MNAWSHLPNAHYIDWVLESLRTDIEKWTAARTAILGTSRDTTHFVAWSAARDTARDTARDVVWNAAWQATRDADRDGWGYTAWDDATRTEAWDAVLALVVYDDCDQYLSMSYEQLLAWATLSEQPQAVLLLSLKWIQEHEYLVTPA